MRWRDFLAGALFTSAAIVIASLVAWAAQLALQYAEHFWFRVGLTVALCLAVGFTFAAGRALQRILR